MKVWNYIFICVTLVLVLAIGGISTGLDGILTLIGIDLTEGSTGSTSPFRDAILGSAGILVGITLGIIIGGLTRTTPENYIILPFITGVLGLFVDTFIKIINYAKDLEPWIFGIVLIIFAPLMVGYYLAMVEFFRGTD